jgi:hypothetical protein
MNTITHKRGNTFSYAGTITLPAGAWTASAQVRDGKAGTLLSTLATTLVAQGANVWALALHATSAQTSTWPVSAYGKTTPLLCDIKFSDGTTVVRTETFGIDVAREVTE